MSRTATTAANCRPVVERNIKTIRAHKFNVIQAGRVLDAGYSMLRIFCYICAPEMAPCSSIGIARADAPCLFGESGCQVPLLAIRLPVSPMSAFSHSFRRDAYQSCAWRLRQAISRYTLQRDVAQTGSGAPFERTWPPPTGCPVALTTSSLLNIRALRRKWFLLLIIRAGIAFATTR